MSSRSIDCRAAAGPAGHGVCNEMQRALAYAPLATTPYAWSPALVAKESKFIGVNDDTSDFHLTFLLTQYRSLRLAKRFNSRLDGLEHEYANAKTIPRVTFLEASVYTMMDDRSMLVEERLETKWEKWNNNSGSVYAEDSRGSRKHGSDQKSPRGLLGIRRDHIKSGATFVPSLATIDEEEDDSGDKKHLTYSPNRTAWFQKDNLEGEENYGRTDRGKKGIDDFFKTHKCSPLCVALRLKPFSLEEFIPHRYYWAASQHHRKSSWNEREHEYNIRFSS